MLRPIAFAEEFGPGFYLIRSLIEYCTMAPREGYGVKERQEVGCERQEAGRGCDTEVRQVAIPVMLVARRRGWSFVRKASAESGTCAQGGDITTSTLLEMGDSDSEYSTSVRLRYEQTH